MVELDSVDSDSAPSSTDDGRQYYKCKLQVQAMTCASCVATIESNVSRMAGVKSVLVALMAGKAEVLYDPSTVQPARISSEISKLGFPCSVLEEVLRQEGGQAEAHAQRGDANAEKDTKKRHGVSP